MYVHALLEDKGIFDRVFLPDQLCICILYGQRDRFVVVIAIRLHQERNILFRVDLCTMACSLLFRRNVY